MDAETFKQRYEEATIKATELLKAYRFKTYKNELGCFVAVSIASKDNPEKFEYAYDIPLWRFIPTGAKEKNIGAD